MKRRQMIMATGLAITGSVAGCQSPNETETETATPTPRETPTEAEKQAAVSLMRKAKERGVKNVRVKLSRDGRKIVLYFQNSSDPKIVFEEIALAYAEVLEENKKVGNLTARTGNLECIVPRSSAKAYNSGTIKKEAYFQTLVIRTFDNPEKTETED